MDPETVSPDTTAAEAQSTTEAPSNVVPLEAATLTVEEQIRDLEHKLELLEQQRAKTAVSELEFSPEVFALVAKQRAAERYPRAWKEVQKHLKQVAYSGERVAYLEPTSPIFNERLVKDLIAEGFKAKIISLGANQGFKIEVKW